MLITTAASSTAICNHEFPPNSSKANHHHATLYLHRAGKDHEGKYSKQTTNNTSSKLLSSRVAHNPLQPMEIAGFQRSNPVYH